MSRRRRGVMVFSQVTRLLWDHQDLPPSHDATGELDYGHLDSMQLDDRARRFVLDVEGMAITVDAAEVTVELLPETPE